MPSRLGPIFGTAVGVADILLNRFRGPSGNDSRFSLNKFKAKLNDSNINGLWQPSRFVVRIHPRDGADSFVRKNVENMSFLCNSAALPGIQIITSDHRRQNMGTFDRRPFGAMVTDIPLTFFIDQRGLVQGLFNSWTNSIINYSFANGEHGTEGGKHLFEVGYRDDYLCDMDIYCLDVKQENIVRYHLYEAFPMQVGDVTTAWSETDSFGVLPVQFTFRTYDVQAEAIGTEGSESSSRPFAKAGKLGKHQDKTRPRLGTTKGGTASTGIGGRPITLPT